MPSNAPGCLVSQRPSFEGHNMFCMNHVLLMVSTADLLTTFTRKLINSGNIQRLVDEHLTDEQISELEEQEAMLKRFLAWDLHALKEDAEAGTLTVLDLKHKLAEVMGVEWNAETGEIRKNGVIVEVEPES